MRSSPYSKKKADPSSTTTTALLEDVHLLHHPPDRDLRATDEDVRRGTFLFDGAAYLYRAFTRPTQRTVYVHVYSVTTERSVYVKCLKRDVFDPEMLEAALLFFEPVPQSMQRQGRAGAVASADDARIMSGVSELGDDGLLIVTAEPEGYHPRACQTPLDDVVRGSVFVGPGELAYQAFSVGRETKITVWDGDARRKLFFTVRRPHFREMEDMATAQQLLSSVASRRIMTQPALQKDVVDQMLTQGSVPPSPQLELQLRPGTAPAASPAPMPLPWTPSPHSSPAAVTLPPSKSSSSSSPSLLSATAAAAAAAPKTSDRAAYDDDDDDDTVTFRPTPKPNKQMSESTGNKIASDSKWSFDGDDDDDEAWIQPAVKGKSSEAKDVPRRHHPQAKGVMHPQLDRFDIQELLELGESILL